MERGKKKKKTEAFKDRIGEEEDYEEKHGQCFPDLLLKT